MHVSVRISLLAAVAAAIFLPSASAADIPKRKSGLWEMHIESDGRSSLNLQACVDEKQDDITAAQSRDMQKGQRRQCTRTDIRQAADRVEIDSVCKFDNVTATSHAVVTGNMTQQYRMDSTTRFDPPMQGLAKSHSTITAKWLGPCKPGQHAGSITLLGLPAGNHARITPQMLKQMQKRQQQ